MVVRPREGKKEMLRQRNVNERWSEEKRNRVERKEGKRVKEPERKTDRRVERQTGKLMAEDNKVETKGNDR